MEDKGRLDTLMLGADILVLWSTDNGTSQVGTLHTVGWGSERRYFWGKKTVFQGEKPMRDGGEGGTGIWGLWLGCGREVVFRNPDLRG